MDEINIARLEQMLEETLELTEENNKMLRTIQRTLKWSFWGKLLLWIVVLVLPFFVLGPLIHSILPVSYSQGNSKSVFGLPTTEEIQNLIQAYRPQGTTTSAK